MNIYNNEPNFTEEEMNIILNIKTKKDNIDLSDGKEDLFNNIDDAEKLRIKNEKLRMSQKKYYEKNKEAILTQQKKYYCDNKQELYKKKREYFKEKYNTDKEFRASRTKAICKAIKIKRETDEEYKLKKNEYSKIYTRTRREGSPEYRKLCNKQSLDIYYRKKLLMNDMNNNEMNNNAITC
jgi:hypothetical protein